MTNSLTFCEINLDALANNVSVAKEYAAGRQIMAVVKADAYGHGIIPVSECLSRHCQGLAVARLEEAVLLRKHLPDSRILLLPGPASGEEYLVAADLSIELVIHEHTQLTYLSCLKAGVKAPPALWVKLDTGMHRLGFAPDEAGPVIETLKKAFTTADIHLMSHFASSETLSAEKTQRQLKAFSDATRAMNYPLSLCNSGALMHHPSIKDDWVRPGIMLYGASPNPMRASSSLQPVMTFYSTVIAVKKLELGESVGYGSRWTARRPTRLAVVAAGYGDGYPIQAPDGTPVMINGQRCPIVGRVSMDMLCVDCTDIAQPSPGDRVELWGNNISVSEVAETCGAISYSLLTGVTPRVKRHYLTNS